MSLVTVTNNNFKNTVLTTGLAVNFSDGGKIVIREI
jgi:hypothetical protein